MHRFFVIHFHGLSEGPPNAWISKCSVTKQAYLQILVALNSLKLPHITPTVRSLQPYTCLLQKHYFSRPSVNSLFLLGKISSHPFCISVRETETSFEKTSDRCRGRQEYSLAPAKQPRRAEGLSLQRQPRGAAGL